jgi:hypothetical protein
MALEWWVIAATLAGPVVAVQTQKWIEKATERRNARRQIFYDLMENRATRLNETYTRALNRIDIEFSERKWFVSRKDRGVIDAWRSLFGELQNGLSENETDPGKIAAWNDRVADLLIDLLSAMSNALGFSFSKEQLKRGTYYPRGHVEREQAQLAILHGMRQIMEGRVSFPVRMTEVPNSPEAVELQKALTERMVKAYDADGALRVRVEPAGEVLGFIQDEDDLAESKSS